MSFSGTKLAPESTQSKPDCSDIVETACLLCFYFWRGATCGFIKRAVRGWEWEKERKKNWGSRLILITHPDKVVWEQPPASAQLALPPSSIVPPYVHDDVAHGQAQLIVLLSLIVELHHGLHWIQRLKDVEIEKDGVSVWVINHNKRSNIAPVFTLCHYGFDYDCFAHLLITTGSKNRHTRIV